MKKILLVTHHDLSDPGIISSLLHSKYLTCNINYKNLPLLKQSDIKEYAAIIIFGGKMSANSKSIGQNRLDICQIYLDTSFYF